MQRSELLRLFPRLLQPKQLAILEASLIGLISGVAAVALKMGVIGLSNWRLGVAAQYPAPIVLPLIGLVGGAIAGFLIERWAPEAAGSGIPQVKAALGGVSIALNVRVAIAKWLSTLFSLGAGLSLGRQGPTVQIGAAIAAQLSVWVPTSPEHRRQLMAAGAAAGLAAGFNAPIAGVLFVVEELLQDVSGLTLGTAILASFVGAVVSRLLGGQDLNVSANVLQIHSSFSAADIPFFLLLGTLAGLLGSLFSRGILLSLKLSRSFRWSGPARIGLAGLITGGVMAVLPAVLRDGASLQEVWITNELSWQTVALLFLTKFVLTLVAFSSGASGGLFAPSLILGSTLGYLISSAAQHVQASFGIPLGLEMNEGLLITSALTGMGAFFSAVTRGPITAIVIVVEMTTDFNLVLPLMIGSVTAYLVAEALHGGSIYKHLLALKGIQLKPNASIETRLSGLTAANIMQPRVETLSSEMHLEEAMQAFARSHHRGFPVMEDAILSGIVTQTDLLQVRDRGLPLDLPLKTIMTPHPVTVTPDAPLTQVLYLLNFHKISRLPVVDRRKLLGIITRADIIRAESDRLTTETPQLGPQPEPSYVVYQTQAPAIGRGRLLVPIANPKTADALLHMAAAIAREHRYELECVQVILVPRHQIPAETEVSISVSRKLLKKATRLGKEWNIPVHTQVRITHDIAHALLETIKERHVDLLLMGWKGSTFTPGRVFGDIVDTMIRQASCAVVLVRFGATLPDAQMLDARSLPFDRWLIPTAGGPNSRQAIQLLPALAQLSQQPQIQLCQVYPPDRSLPDAAALDEAMQFLNQRLDCPVMVMPVCAPSVSEAVIHLAKQDQCDVIVLGATREGLLQKVIQGNIPEEILRRCDRTVILVQGMRDEE